MHPDDDQGRQYRYDILIFEMGKLRLGEVELSKGTRLTESRNRPPLCLPSKPTLPWSCCPGASRPSHPGWTRG